MKFYASLVGPLLGVYCPLPAELDNMVLRRVALNSSRLKHLWCAVYTEEEVKRFVSQHDGVVLPDRYARMLDYDAHEVNLCRTK